jgi:hypothetical protein
MIAPAESAPAVRRRFFCFSLRTLFVLVTVSGIALAWAAHSLSWINQRRQFLSERGPYLIIDPTVQDSHGRIRLRPGGDRLTAPGSLRLFGEDGVAWLMVIEPSDLEPARRLFPEAEILGP